VKNRIGAAALLVAFAALTTAGSSVSTGKAPKKFDTTCGAVRAKERTVNGTLGSVTMHGTPRRIVALEFSFVDDLAALGIKPVGIADDSDSSRIIPQVLRRVRGYTSVGLRQLPNLEKIASLHPDLIIADSQRDAGIYNQLRAIAPTIALDSLKEAYLPNLHAAIVIGQLTNRCGAMRIRVKQDRLIMARMRKAVPKNFSKKAMFAVVTNMIWNVHSDLAYTPSLLKAIGIPPANVVPPSKDANPYIPMSQEDLLASNPDILFIADSPPSPTLYEKWKESPLWGQLRAVHGNQVYRVNTNLWSKARGLLAGELIAQQAVHLLFHKLVPITLPKVTSA
jgi:ABC-type Fe3+-citrate transport system substrate-binding protein